MEPTENQDCRAGSPNPASLPVLTFEEFWHERFAARHAAERAHEEQLQDEAFAGCTHTVCGLELRGMSAYDLLLLHGCENPFVVGGRITPEAVAQFLAVLVDPAPSGWWKRQRFAVHVGMYPYAKACEDIKRFVKRMFVGSGIRVGEPAEQSASESNGQASSPLNMCFLAPLIVEVASGTSWSEESLLAMRLDKLFQYRAALTARSGGKVPYPASDALQSEALTAYGEYLKAFNQAS
jgi:hypothetical protein